MANKNSIVKSRPFNLQEAYELMDDQAAIDALFLRLRRFVFKGSETLRTGVEGVQIGPRYLREAGKVAKNRPYFFMQPLNEQGWLFERTGSGWLVSNAQKIVQTGTFLRTHEPWDVVTIFRPKAGKGTPRVSSQRFGTDLISFAVYENKLEEFLGLDKEVDAE